MKSNIVINIGLSTKEGNPVELHRAIHEIERAGVTILASGVVIGQWEGNEEQTLVVSGLAFESPELRPRLYIASRALSQHCIAIWKDGKGELIGEETNFKFDPDLFHFHAREEKPTWDSCAFALWKGTIEGQELIEVFESEVDAHNAAKRNAEYFVEDITLRRSEEKPPASPGEAPIFIEWLEDTLIPDLKESGSEEIAKDFETLIAYYRAK